MINRKSMQNTEIVEPLDEAEQTRILDNLKEEAKKQTQQQKRVFFFIFLAIAVIFFVCLLYSLSLPWDMNHQVHFQEALPHWSFTLFYLAGVYSFLTAAAIVHSRSQYFVAKIIGYAVAVTSMIVWLVVFWRLGVTNPVLFWLPFANVGGVLLATYVDYDTTSLLVTAESLDKYKYNHKGV